MTSTAIAIVTPSRPRWRDRASGGRSSLTRCSAAGTEAANLLLDQLGRPRQRPQALLRDRTSGDHRKPVHALVDAPQRRIDVGHRLAGLPGQRQVALALYHQRVALARLV